MKDKGTGEHRNKKTRGQEKKRTRGRETKRNKKTTDKYNTRTRAKVDKKKENRKIWEQENEDKRARGPMRGTSVDEKEEQDDKRTRTMKDKRTREHTKERIRRQIIRGQEDKITREARGQGTNKGQGNKGTRERIQDNKGTI
jgi:hypothetical protein